MNRVLNILQDLNVQKNMTPIQGQIVFFFYQCFTFHEIGGFSNVESQTILMGFEVLCWQSPAVNKTQ